MVQALVTPEMQQQLVSEDEARVLECMIDKLTRTNEAQKRIFLLTPEYLYLFARGRVVRRHKLSHFSAIVKSTVSSEFVLVVPQGKDLRISGMSEENFVSMQSFV